jgi:hypothetical protein
MGAPRIHGEPLSLEFGISEPAVSRYLRRLGRNRDASRARRYRAFLNNHREVIAAFDLFTLPGLIGDESYTSIRRRHPIHSRECSEHVAERSRGALGGQCSPRDTRSRDFPE